MPLKIGSRSRRVDSLRQASIVVHDCIKDRLIDAADVFLDLCAFDPSGARVDEELLSQFGHGDNVRADSLRELGANPLVEEIGAARAHDTTKLDDALRFPAVAELAQDEIAWQMAAQRYDIRKEADGSWTVFDVFTGLPWEDQAFKAEGMSMEQADDLVDLVNRLDRKRRADSGD
jgi:hypothetical protein